MFRFLLSCCLVFNFTVAFSVPPPSAIYPFLDDFESYAPNSGPFGSGGWFGSAMSFTVYSGHGESGSQSMSKLLNASIPADSIFTPIIGALTSATVLSFDYRFVDTAAYPSIATQLPADAELFVGISNGVGNPPTPISVINSSNHTVTSGFNTISVPIGVTLPQVVNTNRVFLVRMKGGSSGNYFVDIDNFSVANGTPLSLGNAQTDFARFYVSAPYGRLNISGATESKQIQIMDVRGSVLLNAPISSVIGTSVSDWPAGLYVARVGDKVSKFVVQK